MSLIQHQLARQVLNLIKEGNATHRLLTYQSVAKALGRTPDSARAIAQVCDLLDAATALANIPLLALVAVRATSGEINPKAWVKDTPVGVKNLIIKRSLSHTFTDDDFVAVEMSLNELAGYGNKTAWQVVKRRIPNLYEQLTSLAIVKNEDACNNAINDLGADFVEKEIVSGVRYARDPKVRRAVEARAKGKCELCGKQGFARPDGSFYLETHHIIALAKDGADRVTNVIALCAEHHREAHFGVAKNDLEKRMILKVRNEQRGVSSS